MMGHLRCDDGGHTICDDGMNRRADFCRPKANAPEGCAEDHLAACGCDCCTCSDGLLPHCADGTLPTLPPAPAPECDVTTLSTVFEEINTVCCGPGVDCSVGPPPTCNPRCKDVMLDAWGDNACKSVLAAMPGSAIGDFADLCLEGPAAHPPPPPKPAGPVFSCDYTELAALALECADATASTPGDDRQFCKSPCMAHLQPFLEQCGAAMSQSLATASTIESFEAMAGRCVGH